MTIRQYFVARLEKMGMFQTDAVQVLQNLEVAPSSESMQGRWDQDTEGYPDVLLKAVWIGVHAEAVKFIDETCPNAWYRPMFD